MIAIYLAFAAAGLIFFLSTLFHGVDGVHDFHGGDVHDFHGGDTGGHDGSGEHHDGSQDGDNGTSLRDFLSLRSIALLMLGFGLMGAAMASLGFLGLLVPLSGVAFGILLAWIGIKMMKLLLQQEATTTSSLDDYYFQNGSVDIEIPTGGVGKVLVSSMRGTRDYLTARSEDGQRIAVNDLIEVVGTDGGQLVVRKITALPRSEN